MLDTVNSGHEYLSLADLSQVEEQLMEGFRGDIDANAALPPLAHGDYVCKVEYKEFWPNKEGEEENQVLAADPARRWRKGVARDGGLMYFTWITRTTANNKESAHDGRSQDEYVSTYMMKNGTTAVQALLQALGIDTSVGMNSHNAQIIALDGAIAGQGAFAGVELDWEATVFDKEAVQKDKKGQPIMGDDGRPKTGVERWQLRGMGKFPKLANGDHNPDIGIGDGYKYKADDGAMIPVESARARNFRRRWVPLSAVSQGDGLLEQLEQSVVQAQAQAAPAPAPVSRPQPAQAVNQAPIAPARAATAPAQSGRPGVRRVIS